MNNIKKTSSVYHIISISNYNNNVFITLTNSSGEVIKYWSSGKEGFKGKKKNSTYAIQSLIRTLVTTLKFLRVKIVQISIKGYKRKFMSSLELLISFMLKNKIRITKIINKTPIPYNGTRKAKERRI